MDEQGNAPTASSQASVASKSSTISAHSSAADRTAPLIASKPAPISVPRSRSRKQSLQHGRSVPSDVEDKSLTSFPALSPKSPQTPMKAQFVSPPLAQGSFGGGLPSPPLREGLKDRGRSHIQQGAAQIVTSPVTARRQRPAIVDALTKHSPSFRVSGRRALFEESPTSATIGGISTVPGNIHAADDAHIERLIARTGAVTLVRQLAEDLALREMEVGTIRRAADARERELKKMLHELDVSSLDVERRLRKLDHTGTLRTDGTMTSGSGADTRTDLGNLMREALGDDLGSVDAFNGALGLHQDSSSKEGDGTKSKGWKEYLWSGAKAATPKGASQDETSGIGSLARDQEVASEEDLFSFHPGSDDGAVADDTASTSSAREQRSGSTSWTRTLFGGKTQPPRGDASSVGKGRSDESSKSSTRAPSQSSTQRTSSAQAALLKVKEGNAPRRKAPTSISSGQTPSTKNASHYSQNLPPGSPASAHDPTNYGPVEMDAILPAGTRPPTLSPPIHNSNEAGEPLTDRFGFIYDQRRRKKEAEAFARMSTAKGRSRTDALGTSKESTLASSFEDPGTDRPQSPASTNSKSESRKWQDYLRIATFPTELLAHTPASSTSVMTLGSPEMQESLRRSNATEEAEEAAPMQAAPSTSAVTVDKAEIISPSGPIPASSNSRGRANSAANELEPVKLLLSQLTDLHDNLQRDKEFKWNEFLRKVRAERRRAGEAAQVLQAEGRPGTSGTDTPEALLTDGEIIGIATLGNKGKIGRAKYKEFKMLVLGGIPLAYRAKIWAECSGATSLKVPRYYDDLVAGTGGAASKADDPTVVAQIDADIYRTLTDNVFFRTGHGVPRLREVLRAYARHNPEVGYCQGMNLITASLLLVVSTAEDAFWILASIIDHILPRHYYDHSLLTSRADQQVLRQYVSEVLPRLSSHLEGLAIDLEALTFQWFLSLFTACLSAEALYRVWDVLLCSKDEEGHGGSTFLFQVALALLKLNEPALLACDGPAEIYAYLGDSITNHATSIDGLIAASDGLRAMVRRSDVEERRAHYVKLEQQTLRERERERLRGSAGVGASRGAAVATNGTTSEEASTMLSMES